MIMPFDNMLTYDLKARFTIIAPRCSRNSAYRILERFDQLGQWPSRFGHRAVLGDQC